MQANGAELGPVRQRSVKGIQLHRVTGAATARMASPAPSHVPSPVHVIGSSGASADVSASVRPSSRIFAIVANEAIAKSQFVRCRTADLGAAPVAYVAPSHMTTSADPLPQPRMTTVFVLLPGWNELARSSVTFAEGRTLTTCRSPFTVTSSLLSPGSPFKMDMKCSSCDTSRYVCTEDLPLTKVARMGSQSVTFLRQQ